jgi:alanyl-tRNA synthetase
MALFGAKYGEWVRVVEVDGVSRELCGGTHVANTAEIGIFKIASEGSSAANVRRVEALTGPAAIEWFRDRERRLDQVGELLGSPQDPLSGARKAAERLKAAGEGEQRAQAKALGEEAKRLTAAGEGVAPESGDGELTLVNAKVAAPVGGKQLLELAKQVQAELDGPSAVVLGGVQEGKVGLVALVSSEAADQGVSAREVIGEAAPVIGGGGGGSDEMAQAGGRDGEKLDEALAVARARIAGGDR